MEPVTIAAGALITQVVKSGYEKWVEGQTESLALTDEAKAVLTKMQSDPTDNGVFLDNTSLADHGYSMVCPYHPNLKINTTRRVVTELEAKGLVVIVREDKDEFRDERVKLTHFGWILNPETGEADKVG